MQELKQPVGLAVFLAILRDSRQDSLRMSAKDGELSQVSRVEKDIGLLLERIDPADLRAPDIRPV